MATTNQIPEVGYSDLNREFKIWRMPDIFTGPNGTGMWCPNVGDLIVDLVNGWFLVTTIDITTGLSKWVKWELAPVSQSNVEVDKLLGVGTGAQSETWRVLIDTRQMPYSLQVDGRLHLYRSDATHYKVFLGTDINELTGICISAYYTPSNELVGENIPLEHVGTDDINNFAIWAPSAGNTDRRLNDGEVVTVVLYGSAGQLSRATMLIQNTALVRRSEAGRKNVTSIELQSPYLSDADPRLLLVPINFDIKTVVLTGIVRYDNGDTAEIPISQDGGSKMSLHGLTWYSPTIQSYPKKLTLSYRLSEDEYSVTHGVTENGFITEPYSIKATAADDAYSMKLYTYPTWNAAANRYELDFWLYSIDRDVYFRVPRNVIETIEGYPSFDGQNYTSRQRLKFGVKLSLVDPQYTDHRFMQAVDVLLRQTGVEKGTKWQLRLDETQDEFFGEAVVAESRFVNTNLSYMSLKNNCTSFQQWINKLFYAVNPQFDDTSEVKAPQPTHFVVHTKARTYEFEAESQWDKEFTMFNDYTIGETISIRWIRATPQNRLELGVTGLPVEQTN